MRAYFFGNMYLSSIQQGIQAAHVTAEMFVKYANTKGPNYHPLHEWAAGHKTMILLNAGYAEVLYDLLGFFSLSDNPYPWAEFHESETALNGAFTSIGIVLPGRIYDTAKVCRERGFHPSLLNCGNLGVQNGLPSDLTEWEGDLILKLNEFGLAR